MQHIFAFNRMIIYFDLRVPTDANGEVVYEKNKNNAFDSDNIIILRVSAFLFVYLVFSKQINVFSE